MPRPHTRRSMYCRAPRMMSRHQIKFSSAHRNKMLCAVGPHEQSSPVARSRHVDGSVSSGSTVRARSPPPPIAWSRDVLRSFAPCSMHSPHGVGSLAPNPRSSSPFIVPSPPGQAIAARNEESTACCSCWRWCSTARAKLRAGLEGILAVRLPACTRNHAHARER